MKECPLLYVHYYCTVCMHSYKEYFQSVFDLWQFLRFLKIENFYKTYFTENLLKPLSSIFWLIKLTNKTFCWLLTEKVVDQITYEVTLITGDIRYAGTDANIYIKLYGKLGIARELEFKDTNGKRFEQGATDIIKVSV